MGTVDFNRFTVGMGPISQLAGDRPWFWAVGFLLVSSAPPDFRWLVGLSFVLGGLGGCKVRSAGGVSSGVTSGEAVLDVASYRLPTHLGLASLSLGVSYMVRAAAWRPEA